VAPHPASRHHPFLPTHRTDVRTRLLAVAIALFAAACGGAAASESPPEVPKTAAAEASTEQVELDDELLVPTSGWATDFSKHTVPLSEISPGGPGKDGIPAIDAPKFVYVGEADEWLGAREPVIELELGGEARAYPLQILIWHEIVNDEVGGTPVSVTFCPLCNTALVFDRRLDGRVLDFGTTGNLRYSDLVMYDRQTESWWQQFGGEAIVGELAGKELEQIPARVVAWEEFAGRHPQETVLSRETGHSRPYGQNPYTGYDDVDTPPFFPAANSDDDRLPPKERVVFVERGEEAVVVPLSLLQRQKTVEVTVGGERLEVSWVPGVSSALDSASIAAGRQVGSADVRSLETGGTVAFDLPFWFAVAAFRPNAEIVGR
jgi:Protein of unknown function (DUF3179)